MRFTLFFIAPSILGGNNPNIFPLNKWGFAPRIYRLAESLKNWNPRSNEKLRPRKFTETLGNSPRNAHVDFPKNLRPRKTGARVRRFPEQFPVKFPEKLGPDPVISREMTSREIFAGNHFTGETGACPEPAPVFWGESKNKILS